MAAVETRGVQMSSALSAFKRDQGSYPDGLDKLVPKYALAVAKCPGGTPMAYVSSAAEYVLSCSHVVFRYLPYKYDRYLKTRSEEHTSELQSHSDLVCRLLLDKTIRVQLELRG